MAAEQKSSVDLTHMNTSLVVKAPFDKDFIDDYNMFDSRERIKAIKGILNKQIDFDYYVKTNVILEHYPLHKRNPKDI